MLIVLLILSCSGAQVAKPTGLLFASHHRLLGVWCCEWAADMERTRDDVIKWKHFPRNWPFVREIHRSPVNFPHKGQWRGALMFSLIYVWINDWVNNREAGDLRRQHGHYDVIVMHTLALTFVASAWLVFYLKPTITAKDVKDVKKERKGAAVVELQHPQVENKMNLSFFFQIFMDKANDYGAVKLLLLGT